MIDYSAVPNHLKRCTPTDNGQVHYLGQGDITPATLKKSGLPLLLPTTSVGFSMLDKKFVVEHDTKEFVQTLVTNHLTMDRSTDLISGEGNSLVIFITRRTYHGQDTDS